MKSGIFPPKFSAPRIFGAVLSVFYSGLPRFFRAFCYICPTTLASLRGFFPLFFCSFFKAIQSFFSENSIPCCLPRPGVCLFPPSCPAGRPGNMLGGTKIRFRPETIIPGGGVAGLRKQKTQIHEKRHHTF
ncbi:MAG: hypothetical protein D6714_07725 [Bacteroidetes bacterium]|nr:MAG: hypothetical protein D6714_07725 [Bacteroidota bacterium]